MSDETLKIAMIGHKDFPSRDGGVEVVVEELVTRMVQQGHHLTLYNRGFSKGQPRISTHEGVEVRRCFAPKSEGLNALVSSFTATLEACFQHYDVIHYHAEGPACACLLPHLLGIPTVVTIHGLDWQRSKWSRMAKLYLKLGEWVAAHFADEVIVLSESVQQYFEETYHRKTTVINNGIRPVYYHAPYVIKERWGLEEDSYILFLARLTPEKGLDYLIDAYQQLDTDIKLVIAGRLTDDDYCRHLLEKAKDNPNIIFTDFVQGMTLSELYTNCRVYVLPSEIEGMPLSLLEALSAGDRCLVSDIPENVSVAREYLFTFRSKDTDDLREKLQETIRMKRNMARRQELKQLIREKFNWKYVVERTLNCYRRVLGEEDEPIQPMHQVFYPQDVQGK